MRSTKKFLSCLMCAVMLVVACIGSVAFTTADKVNAAEQATVWVVGDSTVSSFTDAYYYPRYGWGTQLDNYFDDTLKVENLALSGRSSKSFTSEENYKTLINGMASGDYLLVGFGHNDEKDDDETRYTDPTGDYKTEGSFAHSLYTNYVKPAQDKGVTVILCTPIVRRTKTGEWSNSELHITSKGDYAQAIKTLGTTLNIPVVDMTAKTKALYDSLGATETLNLHAWLSSKDTSVDNTHTNIWGGKYNAWLITQDIKAQNVAGIADHIVKADAPTKADTLVSNPDYKEVTYSPVTESSKIFEKVGIWNPTAFGDIGGNPSTANHTLEKDADGNIHMAVANNKGKIGSSDGICMFYYKLPADKTFTLTATMKVNAFAANDQVAFGLMARDAVWLDYNTKDGLGDYVAAGAIKLSSGAWNCFARKSGTLTKGGTCVNAINAGDTLDLKIVSTEDGYACTMGNEETISGGFDFKLTSIDSEYVYVGMFAARNCDVTFSNVKLVVDGKEVDENTVFETPGTGSGDETPGTGSGDETPGTGSDDTDKGTSTVIPSGKVENVVSDVKKSDDTVIVDSEGNTITSEDVYMDIAEADSVTVTEVEKKLGALDVKVAGDVKAKFYDIVLKNKDGKALTMKDGKMYVTFAYPEGTAQKTHNFNVYHLNGDKLEKVNVECTDAGITMEATSFSPYVIVYQPVVQTDSGDSNNALPFAIALMASIVLIAGVALYGKKNRVFG